MAGLSPKLPLVHDPIDGYYQLNKTYKDMVGQNLKMLVLTTPGERIMEPEFGVGLRQFLFQNFPQDEIVSAVEEQVVRYLPFIELQNIEFNTFEGDFLNPQTNALSMTIEYRIIPLDEISSVDITQILD